MSLRTKRSNPVGAMVVFIAVLFISFYNLLACPSGQTCPAGKDCVADSSQCVTDSSSSTTSGSSTAPTLIKDQLGLTFIPVLGADGVIFYTFYDPAVAGGNSSEVNLSAGTTCAICDNFDPQNAPTPPLEGGIWGLPSDVTVH